MQLNNLVVARFLDGQVLKGTTHDFAPNRPTFHVTREGNREVVQVACQSLKALFFVKSLQGDLARTDLRGFVQGPGETQQGRKIAVLFQDEELVCGYAQAWSPERAGFFIVPADKQSNNQRVFVIASAAREIAAGPGADALANRLLAAVKAP